MSLASYPFYCMREFNLISRQTLLKNKRWPNNGIMVEQSKHRDK